LVKKANKRYPSIPINIEDSILEMQEYRKIGKLYHSQGIKVINAEYGHYLETPDSIYFWQQPIGIININSEDFEKMYKVGYKFNEKEKYLYKEQSIDGKECELIMQSERKHSTKDALRIVSNKTPYEKFLRQIKSTRIL